MLKATFSATRFIVTACPVGEEEADGEDDGLTDEPGLGDDDGAGEAAGDADGIGVGVGIEPVAPSLKATSCGEEPTPKGKMMVSLATDGQPLMPIPAGALNVQAWLPSARFKA